MPASGMHNGTQLGAPTTTVVGAFEVHNIANDVYEHNFGWRPTQVLLLSPACPPTTCLSGMELKTASGRHHEGPPLTFLQVNLEGVTPGALDKHQADIWLMSPPCQPFTRRGLQLHDADPRSASFLHLLQLLPVLQARTDDAEPACT